MGIDGGDSGDGMAVVQHLVPGQQIECIEVGVELRLAAVLQLNFAGQRREVSMRDDRLDAGQAQSRLRVYRFDPRMRVGTTQDLAMQHPGGAVVGAVFGTSDDLVDAVVADGPGAYYFELFAILCRSGHRNSPRPNGLRA